MGIDRRDYVVYGYKMPGKYLENKGINIWDDDKYLPYIEGWKDEDYCLIDDGMSGEYTVFGLMIARGGYEGFEFVELPSEGWLNRADEVQAKFVNVFGFIDTELGEPKVLIFSHFS